MADALRRGSPLKWDDGHRGTADRIGERVIAKVWHEDDPAQWWYAPLPIEEAFKAHARAQAVSA